MKSIFGIHAFGVAVPLAAAALLAVSTARVTAAADPGPAASAELASGLAFLKRFVP